VSNNHLLFVKVLKRMPEKKNEVSPKRLASTLGDHIREQSGVIWAL
jgi:hypothetical protein